jgi:type I restriction enzyme M protein
MRIYDPCSGSGGMLIWAREYVEEDGGDGSQLELYGQEDNGSVWSISKMNTILHGIRDADIRNGDTLSEPLHVEAGELMGFDRVISNPPFAQNYSRKDMLFPERFCYGVCPETGKKADLMFVQHMLAVLRPGGMAATIMPHGVLFRTGQEQAIRGQLIGNDVIEAVIGLPANLFYGTGIPACVLILRAPGSKAPERIGKVLFINADREFKAGRAQNELLTEHIEKIVSAYEQFRDIEGYAAVVPAAVLADNEHNLNIRRYVDSAPLPEVHDVRALLHGGVPCRLVDAHARAFAAHGVDTGRLLCKRHDCLYYDFRPDMAERRQIKARIESDPSVRRHELAVNQAMTRWWQQHHDRMVALPGATSLVGLRSELLTSFCAALVPLGVLESYEIAGVGACWWDGVQFEFKALMACGFVGLVSNWVAMLRSPVDDPGVMADPLERSSRLVRRLPAEIGDLNEVISRLWRSLESEEGERSEPERHIHAPDGSEQKPAPERHCDVLNVDLGDAERRLLMVQRLLQRCVQAAESQDAERQCTDLVLTVLRREMKFYLRRKLMAHRRRLIDLVEGWWDTYQVPLRELEKERHKAAAELDRALERLGYG